METLFVSLGNQKNQSAQKERFLRETNVIMALIIVSFLMSAYYVFLNIIDLIGGDSNIHNLVVGLAWLYVFVGSLMNKRSKSKAKEIA